MHFIECIGDHMQSAKQDYTRKKSRAHRNVWRLWGIPKRNFFALIAEGVLYFKVDETNMADYAKHSSKPFVYDIKGKLMTMNYLELPDAIMENEEKLHAWVEKSVQVAKQAKKSSPKNKKKPRS